MGLSTALLLANLAATWYLVGLIWVIQVVHYPLMGAVGADEFRAYHARHTTRISVVVMAPMLAELVTSALLCVWRPAGVSAVWAGVGLGLVVALWLSTFLIQVPLHQRLSQGLDPAVVTSLVRGNWLRTVLWSAHGGVVLVMVWQAWAALQPLPA